MINSWLSGRYSTRCLPSSMIVVPWREMGATTTTLLAPEADWSLRTRTDCLDPQFDHSRMQVYVVFASFSMARLRRSRPCAGWNGRGTAKPQRSNDPQSRVALEFMALQAPQEDYSRGIHCAHCSNLGRARSRCPVRAHRAFRFLVALSRRTLPRPQQQARMPFGSLATCPPAQKMEPRLHAPPPTAELQARAKPLYRAARLPLS